MADFSFLSDTDDSAVEEILAEAADHVALKQISAINLSGVSDSVLPQHLESRFRRLKTFPPSNSADSTRNHVNPVPKGKKSPSGSSSESSYSWLETKTSPILKADNKLFRSGSVSPPPNKNGCLWCSPKTALKKLSFRKSSSGSGDWGRNDGVLEDLGVGSLSKREQEKILKRAAKEERKINEEAEKIVKWANHVSARMEPYGLEDDDEFRYK